MSSNREAQRLQEIVDYIDKAASIIGDRSLTEFRQDEIARLAVERVLQIITEAAIKIGEARMEEIAPDESFAKIRGMGNVLRHGYDEILVDTIYATVKDSLLPLRAACIEELERQRSEM